MQSNRHSGLTLIEIIVVISLISITLVFAVPRFQDSILSDNTNSVSRWIILNVPLLKEQAVREQMRYSLHVDIDADKLWITNESMSEAEIEDASSNGFKLPHDVHLLDVEYPENQRISSGQADIFFYKKGYSDRAFVHIKDEDNRQLSFLIETFLSKVKLYETYIGFEDG